MTAPPANRAAHRQGLGTGVVARTSMSGGIRRHDINEPLMRAALVPDRPVRHPDRSDGQPRRARGDIDHKPRPSSGVRAPWVSGAPTAMTPSPTRHETTGDVWQPRPRRATALKNVSRRRAPP